VRVRITVEKESWARGEGEREGVLIDDVEKQRLDKSEGALPEAATPNPNGCALYRTQPC
jgi:hypothetical protein